MAHYFVSDVHLREDQPKRDSRFRAWLGRLTPADALVIVGDLCDFWMSARSSEDQLASYPSLQALAEFTRKGGSLAIMAGNHDAWLCPFYARTLGARIIDEPHDMTIDGLRVRLVHGHHQGAQRLWKTAMESRAFFRAFGLLPRPLARPLDRILAWKNDRGLHEDEARHLRLYRAYAAACRDVADLVIFGHVHSRTDDAEAIPRLVVLGGWQRQSSYLTIDEAGASFHVLFDGEHPEDPGSSAWPCHSSQTC